MRAATSQKGNVMKKQYFVNLIDGVVYVDPMFVKKSGQFGTPEFDKFMELKKTLPDFTFEVKNLNETKKNVYNDLTYEVMEAFINFYEPTEKRAAVLTVFRKIRAESLFKKAPYSFVKSWFLKNYKDEYNKSSFAEERKGKRAEAIQKLNHPAAASVKGVVSNG